MAVISVIKLSELEGAKRVDAEYYQPIYEKLKKLENFKKRKLFTISIIAYGTTPEGGIFLEQGIPFVRSQSFDLGMVNDKEIVFCDDKFHRKNSKSTIGPNDILFAVVGGTIGQVAIVQTNIKEGNINQNIARVRICSQDINPIYAGLFFMSKYGQMQISRLSTGNAQPYLNTYQIGSLEIPIINPKIQNEINNIFRRIEKLYNSSKLFYSQAESILLSELGLQDFKPKEKLSYKVSLFEVSAAHRIDAEYFNPRYDEIFKRINNKVEMKPLNKFLISVKKGIEVGSEKYQEEGMPFIRVSNLSIHGLIDKDQKFIDEKDYNILKDKFEPTEGEILLTKDATPGIAYFVKEPIKGIISSGILRLKVKDINPEYLCLCINSIIGKSQIERDGGGSVITHWKPNQIKSLQIPILPKPTQQKIAKLIQESHEARRKAKQLLEEAKKKVEEAIERNFSI